MDEKQQPVDQNQSVDAPPPYAGTTKPPLQSQPVVQYVYATQPTGPPPNDYIIFSVLNILCCFWPLGVIALIKSIETRSHYNNGRQLEAETSSREARKYNWWAFGVGLGINIAVWFFVITINVITQVAVRTSV